MKLHSRKEWDNISPKDQGSKDCVFCNGYNGEPEYIVQKFKYWFIVHNKYPVLGLDNQLMAIPNRHVILAKDLYDEELIDYRNVEKFVYDFYKGEHYFTFMRESLESRSLEHLHYHFISGRIGYEDLEYFLKKQGF